MNEILTGIAAVITAIGVALGGAAALVTAIAKAKKGRK
jgi:succinate-acetate transporter protein